MFIGTLIGFIIAVIIAASVIAAALKFKNRNKKAAGVCLCIALVGALAFAVVPLSFKTVQTGEVAVVKHLGLAKEVKTPGTYFSFWLTDTYDYYDTKVQNVDIITASYSSDAQTMNVQMTLQYRVMADKVLNVAGQYGSLDTLQNRIQSIAIEKTKSILSSYKAMDIIANRAAMSPEVEQAIIKAVGDEYFVNVVAVVLTNIDFSDAFEQAVEEKMIAEQSKLKAEYENETKVARAEAEAQAKLKAAEAEIEIAKAEAEAKKIAAAAEAEANEIVEKSLTDSILREKYLEKWDGKLPDVVAGSDNTSILIPVGDTSGGGN